MEFYETYNGAPYNNLEPDSLCHAVWVSNVEWGHDGLPPLGHTELPTCPGIFILRFFSLKSNHNIEFINFSLSGTDG